MRNGLITALDIGSTKVCCFIARVEGHEPPRVIGIGHHLARGLRAGSVVSMEELETSIRAAVEAAEEMAGERVRKVVMNVACGQPKSENVAVEVSIDGHPVNEADIRQMLEHGREHHNSPDRELLHALPLDYTIDGNEGVRDPRGMYGQRLGVAIHVVTARTGPVRNLATVVNRCHLDIAARVVSPYASGLACLKDDEKELGITCIDLGGGTTTIAVFLGGQLVHTDVIAVGGHHVTNDIARGLSTPLAHAERLKTLYGSAIPSAADDREFLKVPLVGEDEDETSNQVPRSALIEIINPRLEETFEMVRANLEDSGFDRLSGRSVVLTGGASQMQGVHELATHILGKQARIGRPEPLQGLPEATGGPAFSTCAGLIRYAINHQLAVARGRRGAEDNDDHAPGLGRIGQWLRKNF